MTWWQTLIISTIPSILVALLSAYLTNLNFKKQQNLEKEMNAYENLMPVLEECINGQPIKMLNILSINKKKIYLYASCPAVRLLEEIMQNSFKFFKNEINHFRSGGSSNIPTKKALENFQNNAHLIILLFCQIKYDITNIVVSPMNYLNLFFDDVTYNQKLNFLKKSNKAIKVFHLNKKFKMKEKILSNINTFKHS